LVGDLVALFAARARGALGDHDDLLAGLTGRRLEGIGRHGKRCDVTTADGGRGLADRGFDVGRVVVAAVDDDQVFDSPGQVQLTVEVDAEIPGRQPRGVVRNALGVAALVEPGLQLVAEYASRLLLAAEVAAGDVVAVQPDFTDGAIGQL